MTTMEWIRSDTHCLSTKGRPTQLRRSLAPNLVFVLSKTHISEPWLVWSVSFRYISKLESVLAANRMCTLVVNLVKNFVSKKASAIPKAERYLIAWARATTTRLGKSVIEAMSSPKTKDQDKILTRSKRHTTSKALWCSTKLLLIGIELRNHFEGIGVVHNMLELFSSGLVTIAWNTTKDQVGT